MLDEIIGTTEAARLLGISPRQCARLAESGELVARKIGRGWATTKAEVEALKRRRDGQPRKS